MNLAPVSTPKGRYQRANILQIVPVLLIVFAIGNGWLWFTAYCAIMLFSVVNQWAERDDRHVRAAAPDTHS